MQAHPRNVRHFAERATFSLRLAQLTQVVINVPLRPTTNWLQIKMGRCTGVTRRFLKRDYASRKKGVDPAHSRRSIKFWRTNHALVNGGSCSGTTRLDSMQRDCWRKIRSGNLQWQSTTSSWQPEAAVAKKQKHV